MKYSEPVLLKFTTGPMKMRQFTLMPGESYIIGSHTDSDIRIDGDPTVSRRHACLSLQANGRLSLNDLSSTNGTRVNGTPISQYHRLKSGDSIQFGLNTLSVIQPWLTLESSLPPGMRSGHELIPAQNPIQKNLFKMTVPLWFTVGGFCFGGMLFSAWLALENPNHVLARTTPAADLFSAPLPPMEKTLKNEESLMRSKVSGENLNDVDVPFDNENVLWEEILNISQRFGEPTPSQKDHKLLSQVQHWIKVYNESQNLNKFLENKEKIWNRIGNILESYKLPADLGYIAWVESGFGTEHLAKNEFNNIWQLSASTFKEFGIPRLQNIDLYSNLDASTHATARYICSLIKMFGQERLLLAISLFKPGQNQNLMDELKQKMNAAGQIDFWSAKEMLPKESLEYVSKVLAAMIVARNPGTW